LSEDNKQKIADNLGDDVKSFEARLQKARNLNPGLAHTNNVAIPEEDKIKAMRIGTELIVAVFIGGGIGFLIDTWLGTKPWFLIGFLFLGNAAGLWNIFRLTNGQSYKIGFDRTKTSKPTK